VLNQPTYSTIASSSWVRVRQTRVGDQLGLERVDEALGERVVRGVADAADRAAHAGVVERLGVVAAGIFPDSLDDERQSVPSGR
jgi:hypothetical protein